MLSLRGMAFLLLPNYSMIALSLAVEVLRMANQLGRQEHFQWPTYTLDGNSVLASNGLKIIRGKKLEDAGRLDLLFVCTGMHVQQQWVDQISHCHINLSLVTLYWEAFVLAPTCSREPVC